MDRWIKILAIVRLPFGVLLGIMGTVMLLGMPFYFRTEGHPSPFWTIAPGVVIVVRYTLAFGMLAMALLWFVQIGRMRRSRAVWIRWSTSARGNFYVPSDCINSLHNTLKQTAVGWVFVATVGSLVFEPTMTVVVVLCQVVGAVQAWMGIGWVYYPFKQVDESIPSVVDGRLSSWLRKWLPTRNTR